MSKDEEQSKPLNFDTVCRLIEIEEAESNN